MFQAKDHQVKVQDALSKSSIFWYFMPTRSPHFGGLRKSAVKFIKLHLFHALGNAYFTHEELNTILTRLETCLNSRPLTLLSLDPSDPHSLTLGQFLIGGALCALPEKDVSSMPISLLTRWSKVIQVSQQIWYRWSREYLEQLQE